MTKKCLVVVTTVLLVGLICLPAFYKGKQGQAGKSNIAHLDLDPVVAYVDAWGKIKYNLEGPTLDFVLNVKGLMPGAEYVLRSRDIVLGGGIADEEGNLHLAGSVDGTGLANGKFNLWDEAPGIRILRSDFNGFTP